MNQQQELQQNTTLNPLAPSWYPEQVLRQLRYESICKMNLHSSEISWMITCINNNHIDSEKYIDEIITRYNTQDKLTGVAFEKEHRRMNEC